MLTSTYAMPEEALQAFTTPFYSDLNNILDHIRFAYTQFSEAPLFYGHGTDNPWDEAVQLVLQSLYIPWDADKAIWNAVLTEPEKRKVQARIQARIKKKIPVPYLTGEAWFMGLPFYVNSNVLIPRSPIAELLEKQLSPWLVNEPFRILDMCTGSGCIGIAAALQFDNAIVDLVDISEEALKVAKDNVSRYDLDDRVNMIKSDLFDQLSDKYDLILTNPPYVNKTDFDEMPDEYRNEPELGLVSGEDGLNAPISILKQVKQYLAPEGLLVMEVGNSWVTLEDALPHVPFTWVEFEHGGHGVFVMSESEVQSFF